MKKIISLLLCLLLTLALCACGSESASYSKASDAYTEGAYYEAPQMESGDWDAEEPGGLAANAAENGAALGGIEPEKIIYTASATLETLTFDETLERLQTLIEQYDGFVESSSVSGNEYRSYGGSRRASYRIRIPSGRFQELMGSLSTLGNVPYTSTSSENVSARYYDTQARITALKTQEQRLLEMMEQAENVSELIEIEDRLSSLRYEIESYQTTLNNWDRQVSYSTVNLTVEEVREYTPEPSPGFGQQLGDAARRGWEGLIVVLSGLLLFLLEALPALLVLAAIVVFVVIAHKRKKARRAKAASAAPSEKKD